MPVWLIAILVAGGGYLLWKRAQPSTGGTGPAQAPGGQPAPYGGTPVPTTIDASGATLVTLTPDVMGVLNVQSGPGGTSIDVQAGQGVFVSGASSNPSMLDPSSLIVPPGQPGAGTQGTISLGSATVPGTATLLFDVQDSTGTWSSTFTVIAN